MDDVYLIKKETLTNISSQIIEHGNIPESKLTPQFMAGHVITVYDNGYSKGYDEGYTTGHNTGLEEGAQQGYNEGYEIGLEEGRTQGYEEGKNEPQMKVSWYFNDSMTTAIQNALGSSSSKTYSIDFICNGVTYNSIIFAKPYNPAVGGNYYTMTYSG